MPAIANPDETKAAALSAIEEQMRDWGFTDPENFFWRHTVRNAYNTIVMRLALLVYHNNLDMLEGMKAIPEPILLTPELAKAIETAYKAYNGRADEPLDRVPLVPVFKATGTHDCDELEMRTINHLRGKGVQKALQVMQEQRIQR